MFSYPTDLRSTVTLIPRDSAVDILARLRALWPRNREVQIISGFHPIFSSVSTAGSFSEGTADEAQTWPLASCNVELHLGSPVYLHGVCDDNTPIQLALGRTHNPVQRESGKNGHNAKLSTDHYLLELISPLPPTFVTWPLIKRSDNFNIYTFGSQIILGIQSRFFSEEIWIIILCAFTTWYSQTFVNSFQLLVPNLHPYTTRGLLVINFIIFHFIMNSILLLFPSPSSKVKNLHASSCLLATKDLHFFSQNITERVKLQWRGMTVPTATFLSVSLGKVRSACKIVSHIYNKQSVWLATPDTSIPLPLLL